MKFIFTILSVFAAGVLFSGLKAFSLNLYRAIRKYQIFEKLFVDSQCNKFSSDLNNFESFVEILSHIKGFETPDSEKNLIHNLHKNKANYCLGAFTVIFAQAYAVALLVYFAINIWI